jgi:hypothetical protein
MGKIDLVSKVGAVVASVFTLIALFVVPFFPGNVALCTIISLMGLIGLGTWIINEIIHKLQSPVRLMFITNVGDSWFGVDKLLHLLVSFSLVVLLGMMLVAFHVTIGTIVIVVGSLVILIGIIKEIVDVKCGGKFSLRDVVADLVGVFIGCLFIL